MKSPPIFLILALRKHVEALVAQRRLHKEWKCNFLSRGDRPAEDAYEVICEDAGGGGYATKVCVTASRKERYYIPVIWDLPSLDKSTKHKVNLCIGDEWCTPQGGYNTHNENGEHSVGVYERDGATLILERKVTINDCGCVVSDASVSAAATCAPSSPPTEGPSAVPSGLPSSGSTPEPSPWPSMASSSEPSSELSAMPSARVSLRPSYLQSRIPSSIPSEAPPVPTASPPRPPTLATPSVMPGISTFPSYVPSDNSKCPILNNDNATAYPCDPSDSNISYGNVTLFSRQINYTYEIETAPNTTTARIDTIIIPCLERTIVDLVVNAVFADTCQRSSGSIRRRSLEQEERLLNDIVAGIANVPHQIKNGGIQSACEEDMLRAQGRNCTLVDGALRIYLVDNETLDPESRIVEEVRKDMDANVHPEWITDLLNINFLGGSNQSLAPSPAPSSMPSASGGPTGVPSMSAGPSRSGAPSGVPSVSAVPSASSTPSGVPSSSLSPSGEPSSSVPPRPAPFPAPIYTVASSYQLPQQSRRTIYIFVSLIPVLLVALVYLAHKNCNAPWNI